MADPVTDAIGRDWKRNNGHAAVFEFFWGAGMPFCMPFAVLPLYFLALDQPKTVLQITLMIVAVLGVLQLWSGAWSHGPRRHPRVSGLWLLSAFIWLAYGATALLAWGRAAPPVFAGVLMAGLLVGGAAFHLANPAYCELLVENTPVEKRGAMAGLRIFANGAGALLFTPAAAFVMRLATAPANYHWRFITGGCLIAIGVAWFLLFYRDHAARRPPLESHALSPLAVTRRLLASAPFRRFLVGHMLLLAAQSLAPLLIGFGKEQQAMTPMQLERFVLSFFLGIITLGLLLPWLADRSGFRRVAILNAFCMAAAFLLPLLTRGTHTGLYIAYAIYGANLLVGVCVLANFGAELIPDVRSSSVFAAASVLAGPLCVAVGPVGGVVVDKLGPRGYPLVFAGGAALALAAAAVFLFRVQEPRRAARE